MARMRGVTIWVSFTVSLVTASPEPEPGIHLDGITLRTQWYLARLSREMNTPKRIQLPALPGLPNTLTTDVSDFQGRVPVSAAGNHSAVPQDIYVRPENSTGEIGAMRNGTQIAGPIQRSMDGHLVGRVLEQFPDEPK